MTVSRAAVVGSTTRWNTRWSLRKVSRSTSHKLSNRRVCSPSRSPSKGWAAVGPCQPSGWRGRALGAAQLEPPSPALKRVGGKAGAPPVRWLEGIPADRVASEVELADGVEERRPFAAVWHQRARPPRGRLRRLHAPHAPSPQVDQGRAGPDFDKERRRLHGLDGRAESHRGCESDHASTGRPAPASSPRRSGSRSSERAAARRRRPRRWPRTRPISGP